MKKRIKKPNETARDMVIGTLSVIASRKPLKTTDARLRLIHCTLSPRKFEPSHGSSDREFTWYLRLKKRRGFTRHDWATRSAERYGGKYR